MNKPRPKVKLIGTDGNAFAVMGVVTRAMKEAGWTEEERDEVLAEMMAGDYKDLLCVVMDVFEVE